MNLDMLGDQAYLGTTIEWQAVQQIKWQLQTSDTINDDGFAMGHI